nr:hypothetical protein [Streptomyces sp. DSM 41633]
MVGELLPHKGVERPRQGAAPPLRTKSSIPPRPDGLRHPAAEHHEHGQQEYLEREEEAARTLSIRHAT